MRASLSTHQRHNSHDDDESERRHSYDHPHQPREQRKWVKRTVSPVIVERFAVEIEQTAVVRVAFAIAN